MPAFDAYQQQKLFPGRSLKKKIMSPIENLYYAIGQLAYAVAISDGQVQKPERKKFHDLVAAGLRCEHYGFDISSIIFQILDKEHENVEDTYKWAINQVKVNSHYLSPELKATAIKVMEKVAQAFPPVTREEGKLIKRFRKDIAPLKGDPIYYGSKL
jgi:uncharacterized tellurite resistance protein B-like protein